MSVGPKRKFDILPVVFASQCRHKCPPSMADPSAAPIASPRSLSSRHIANCLLHKTRQKKKKSKTTANNRCIFYSFIFWTMCTYMYPCVCMVASWPVCLSACIQYSCMLRPAEPAEHTLIIRREQCHSTVPTLYHADQVGHCYACINQNPCLGARLMTTPYTPEVFKSMPWHTLVPKILQGAGLQMHVTSAKMKSYLPFTCLHGPTTC